MGGGNTFLAEFIIGECDVIGFRQAIDEAPFATVALLSGPEGGFEEEEVAQAKAAGLQICTLGSRILRCETAPLCALSALMYAVGEF